MFFGGCTMKGRRFHPGFAAFADFGPWSRRGRFFEAGEVRLALLSLLADQPRHGYELMKELETRSGGMYKASAGTVYPTLQQLEDEGLITSEEEEGKKVYRLTDSGRAELERKKATVRRIWRRADSWQEWGDWIGVGPEIGEITGPVAGVVRAAFRATGACGAHRRETARRVRDILERARDELEALLPDD